MSLLATAHEYAAQVTVQPYLPRWYSPIGSRTAPTWILFAIITRCAMMRWRDRASAHDLSVVIEWVVLFLALQHTYFTLNETGILL